MKILKCLFVGMLLLVVSACDSVTSSALVGEKPESLVAEEWDGAWLSSEGAVTLQVVNAEQGQLLVAWIEESGGKLKMETWQVQIRSSGSWSFANVKDDEGEEVRYLFARVKKDERQILFWLPDSDAFTTAVKAGHLPGEISDSSVRLQALNASHLEYIRSDTGQSLFDWDEPLALFRVRN